MIFMPFESRLTRCLEADELSLPVTERGQARLLGLLRHEGESILLVLDDRHHSEEIECGIVCGKLVILERGVGDTVPRKFPAGTDVLFRVTVTVVRKLVCSTECCPEGPCPCVPVAYAGGSLPSGTVGTPWQGTVLFSGDGPVTLGWQIPHWMEASRDERTVTLSGIPPEAGEVAFTVSGANCGGRHIAVTALQFGVSEPT